MSPVPNGVTCMRESCRIFRSQLNLFFYLGLSNIWVDKKTPRIEISYIKVLFSYGKLGFGK
jgi:hypothetical protein